MTTTPVKKIPTVGTLLESVIDYAGLFPPANLNLLQALQNYANAKVSKHSWILGRFLVPLPKLQEFEELALVKPIKIKWTLGVIVTGDPTSQVDEIKRFNDKWSKKAKIESIEISGLELSNIGPVTHHLPKGLETFFEVNPRSDLEAYLEAITAVGAFAKIRTGGITANAFPNKVTLCQFMMSCMRAQLPFKATAGLHHALTGHYPLTYKPDSARAPMYGFLNVLIAALLINLGKIGLGDANEILSESSPHAFKFSLDTLQWKDLSISNLEITKARQQFFKSFGSCSFEEPIVDLEALRIL